MSKLEQIQSDIEALSDEEIRRLDEWFAELKSDLWDKQIEADAKAGRLDKPFEKARKDIEAGDVTPL